MNKLFFLLIASISAVGVSQAQENPAPSATAPEMTFEKDLHDYGTIKQGANGTYEFKFKNTGKEPLIITNAQGSCGCTVPSWPKEPILPGQGNVIKVTYDTKRIGPFNKSVTLTTNGKTTTKIINIKGMVQEEPEEESFPGKQSEGGPFEKK